MTDITKRDKFIFTCGACHQLAYEIHKLTGWPMYAFHDDSESESWQSYDHHVFVQTPFGTFLDVTGEHNRQEMIDGWSYGNTRLHVRKLRRPKVLYDNWQAEWGKDPFPGSSKRAQKLAPIIVLNWVNQRLEQMMK